MAKNQSFSNFVTLSHGVKDALIVSLHTLLGRLLPRPSVRQDRHSPGILTIPVTAHGNAFDFIRLLAAFGVLFSHSFLVNRLPESRFFDGETLGQMCVFVFFSVSGYLVQASWDRGKGLTAFMVNRGLRIYPGLFVCLLLTTFVLAPSVSSSGLYSFFTNAEPFRYFYSNLVMAFQPRYVSIAGVFKHLPDANAINGSLWTIRYEITMYVVIAAVALGCRNGMRALSLLTLACIVLWSAALFRGIEDPTVLLWRLSALGLSGTLLKFAPFFMVGAILSKMGNSILSTRLALLAAALLLLTAHSKYIVVLLWLLLPYCVIVFAYKAPKSLHHVGKYGDFSYGVYLYAFPVQQTLIHFGIKPWWQQLIAASVITLCFAVLSWNLVESPSLKWKDRLLKRKMQAPTVPV